ncbi:MAG TPA: energy-coupling factor transporter transmembrane component T [Candidatus Limnocylindrales bacterium]|nr:energy-coupling factor transporter transmembrane component T [Candidatus Limnocylindrales bacterium]
MRPAEGVYHRLNPTTKLVIAFAAALIAFGVRGWSGPVGVLGVVGVTAAVAGIGRGMRPFVLATLPLIASILIVNTFLYPDAHDVLFRVGPLAATGTGLAAALQASLRVVAFALSVAVFSLTTPTDDLLVDLEHRGLGRRGVFVIGAAIRTIPRMAERAGEIVESQRARALDTEGSLLRRVRGLVPLAGPLILGALSDVEERTMALEARAFSAPGRRTTLRPIPDTAGQRAVRWLVALGSLALLAATAGGVITPP